MVLGIDLGATQLRVGYVEEGTLIDVKATLLDKTRPPSSILEQIADLIDPKTAKNIKGIGIGVPGLVDLNTGTALHLLNIPGWDLIPLKQLLENRYAVPVSVSNDANCFALGCHKYEVSEGITNLVGLTLGTGLGAGVITANNLNEGQLSAFGELGLMPYKDGILEHYASGMFFASNGWQDGALLAQQATLKNQEALNLFLEYGRHLGQAIRMALFAYAPEVIVLGGSVAQSFSFFESSMTQQLADFPYPKLMESLKITVSKDPYIALLGAAALVEN